MRQTRARARLFGAVMGCAGLLLTASCTHAASAPSAATTAASTAAAVSASGSASAPASAGSSAPVTSASASAIAGGIDPLTGLPALSPAAATRPALGVKIDNVVGAWPQAGLNQADIVFDLPVEGGLTRLLAVFHSQDVGLFGPVRSARPVDADILHLLGHAYFAFSGGSKTDLGPLNDHSNATQMWWDVTPSLFVTRTDHAVPHQVFSSTALLYAGGEKRTPSTSPPPPVFSYGAALPSTALPAHAVTAQYDAATASWTWNGKQYVRNQSGHPDMLMDGTQVSATNVVVMSVGVKSTAAHDSHGTVVPLPLVIGSGSAWVFRNGLFVKGTWSRATENAPMKLQTSTGPIVLAPGRTWVEVLPDSHQPQVS